MTISSARMRWYIYGVDQFGNEEFLVSMLNETDAVSYSKDHSKMFTGRFSIYFFKTARGDVLVYDPREDSSPPNRYPAKNK